MNRPQQPLGVEIAAGMILHAMRVADRAAEKASDQGLQLVADAEAEAALVLAQLFQQLTGRVPPTGGDR